MRLRRIFAWFAGLLILLLCGVAAWLWTTDLGRFQASIETTLSEQLGRGIRAGDLSLRLGRTVRLVAEDVQLDNPEWAPDSRLLAIQRLEADLRLVSLVGDGPVIVERVRLDGLDLAMFWDEQGRNSFQFDTPAGKKDAPATHGTRLPVILRDVEMDTARLVLNDPGRDAPIDIDLQRLSLSEDQTQRLEIAFEGRINELEARFDGALGPSEALLRGGALEVEGSGAFGTLAIEGQGVIDDVERPDRPSGILRLAGPDIRDVERLLGLEPGTPGEYEFTIEARAENTHWAVDLAGHVGEFRIDVDGSADGLQTLESYTLDAHLAGPNLQNILRLFGLREVPPEPFKLDGRVQRDRQDLVFDAVSIVIGETSFDLDAALSDFPQLDDSRLDLRVAGPDIGRFRALFGLSGIAEGPFVLEAEIVPVPNGVDLLSANVRSNLGDLDLQGTLSGRDGLVGSEAKLTFQGNDAQAFFDALEVSGFPPDPFSLEGELVVGERGIDIGTASLRGLLGMTVDAHGRIGFEFWSGETDFQLRLRGDDLSRTFRDYDVAWPLGSDAFDLSTRLRAAAEGIYLDEVSGTIGQAVLTGNALIPLAADLGGLDIAVQARGPNLEALLADTVGFDVPAVDWSAAARIRRAGKEFQLRGLDVGIARSTVRGELTLPWPITEGNGRFSLAGDGPELSRSLPRIADFHPPAVPFEFHLDGDVSDGRWRFERAQLQLERAQVEVTGTFDDLPDFSATDLSIQVRAPDLSRLGYWDRASLPAVPLNVDASLKGSPTDVRLDRFTLAAGDSAVEGSGRYAIEDGRPVIGLELTSPDLDLRPFLPPPDDEPLPPASTDDRVIPDWPLPLEALAKQDADIDIAVGGLETHRRIVTDLAVNASLRDGVLVLERYHARGLRGDILAKARLTPLGDGRATLDLDIDATELAPNREAWKNADPATLPRIDASGSLTATGTGLRSLAASLDGQFVAVASEGTLPGEGLGSLNLGLLDIVAGVLVPDDITNRPTELRCFAARLKAEDGLLTTEPMAALSTDRVLVLSSGSIDLRSERLDVGFKTTPTRLLDINLAELVNPFVRIRGTLAAPAPEVDPAGTLVYGGAAAATGGLSIIAQGLWNRLRGSAKPCEALREELRAEYAAAQER